MVTTIQAFNESLIDDFSRPQPVSRVMRIFREWMGTGHRAIDVGCGSGFYTNFCHNLGNSIVGIDITTQVKAVKAKSLDVCQGNVEGFLPFPDSTFSLALCIEVVEHLLQPDLMLTEISRVLRPGGKLIITTPNYAYWVLRILYLFGQLPVGLPVKHFHSLFRRVNVTTPPSWRGPHIRFFTLSTLMQLLHQVGFEGESIRSSFVAFPSGLAPYLPVLLGLPLRAIGKLIGNLNCLGDSYPSLLTSGLLVKATKLSK